MSRNFEVVGLKNSTQIATLPGKLRLLGFRSPSDFKRRKLDLCERLSPQSAGLVPMVYEVAVIWCTFFDKQYTKQEFQDYLGPRIPEPVLDLLETTIKVEMFSDYRILQSTRFHGIAFAPDCMLVAFDDESRKFTDKPLCSLLLKHKERMPPIYKLAHWSHPGLDLVSTDLVKEIIQKEIRHGTGYQGMSRDLRENALQACSAI